MTDETGPPEESKHGNTTPQETMITDLAIAHLHPHAQSLGCDVLHLRALPQHHTLIRACALFRRVVVYERDEARVAFFRAVVDGVWRPSDTVDPQTDPRQKGFATMVSLAARPSSVSVHKHRQNEANAWLALVKTCRNVICWLSEDAASAGSAVAETKSAVILVGWPSPDAEKVLDRPLCLWAPRDGVFANFEKLPEMSKQAMQRKHELKTRYSDTTHCLYIAKGCVSLLRPGMMPPRETHPGRPRMASPHPGPHNTTKQPTTVIAKQTKLSF